MMADQSDSIKDLITYYNLMVSKKYDAVLGSRFLKESKVTEYPIQKLILNRIFNLFVSLVFLNSYNDYTNAFKIYKKTVLLEVMPLIITIRLSQLTGVVEKKVNQNLKLMNYALNIYLHLFIVLLKKIY